MTASTKSFYCWTHQGDVDLAAQAIAQLRRFHPDDEVLLFSDGTVEDGDLPIFHGLDITFINAGHPKWLHTYDFLHVRYQTLLATSDRQVFIKFDPDSQFHRPVEPLETDWFGQLLEEGDRLGTFGCGMGLSRAAIEAFLAIPVQETNFQYRLRSGEMANAEDSTLTYYLDQAGIVPEAWPAVCLKTMFAPIFLTRQWSITHPSLGKDIPNHRYHRLVVDSSTPQAALEKVAQQLGQNDFRGVVYLAPGHGEAYQALKQHLIAYIRVGELPDPHQAGETLTLAADGLIYVGGQAIADPMTSSIRQAWFSINGIQAREEAIRQAFNDPKDPRYISAT